MAEQLDRATKCLQEVEAKEMEVVNQMKQTQRKQNRALATIEQTIRETHVPAEERLQLKREKELKLEQRRQDYSAVIQQYRQEPSII